MRAGFIGRGIAVLCIAVAGPLWADADTGLTTLHHFAARSANDYFLNADGVGSGKLLLASNGVLYGVRSQGGPGKAGTFFRISTAGTFDVLREFASTGTLAAQYPRALIQDAAGDIFVVLHYSGRGIGLLKYAPATGTFTDLPPAVYSTQGFSATTPTALADGNNDGYVYVTASSGTTTTTNTNGVVIRIAKSNGAQAALKHFIDGADGASPGGLTRAGDGNFYGFTKEGGGALVDGSREAAGTLFRISPAGTFATVHLFRKSDIATIGNGMFSLALGSDGHLYGQTQLGGTSSVDGGSGGGVLFRFTTAGQYTAIRERARLGDFSAISHLNIAGQPFATMNGQLYASKDHSIYRMSTTGQHDLLHAFTGVATSADGHYVDDVLVAAGNVVYAMTTRGGANDNGTIVRLDPSDGTLLELTADPATVPDGGRTTVSWNSAGGASCTAIGGPPYTAPSETSWHGSTRPVSGCMQSTITNNAHPDALEVTYALRCAAGAGFVTASRAVQMTASTGTTSGPACPGGGDPGDPPPDDAAALTDGVGRAVSGAGDSTQAFYIDVPAGATSLTVTIAGGSGDADLYVRRGSPATESQYDCNSTSSSNDEQCSFDAPGEDRYHVLVLGYTTFSGATLTADYVMTGGGDGDGGSGGGGGALSGAWLLAMLFAAARRRRNPNRPAARARGASPRAAA
jgi:hypothetical protein